MAQGPLDSERGAVLRVLALMGSAELGSLDDLRAVLHPSFECWMGAARQPLDADGYIASVRAMRAAFADLSYEVPAPPVIEGHRAATTYRVLGTHTGTYEGLAPTNNRVDVGGVSLFELEDGCVRRMWSALDSMAMATQLGVFGDSGRVAGSRPAE